MLEFGRSKTEFEYYDDSHISNLKEKQKRNIEFWKKFFEKNYPDGLFVETDEPVTSYINIPLPENEWYIYKKNGALVKNKVVVRNKKISNIFSIKEDDLVSECGSFEIPLAYINIPENITPDEFISNMLKNIIGKNGDY